ncbi:MAG: tyrosine-protein phosphatase [Bacteroidales bacterium]|nr:tyrosine-protein phosphatase [Bacteroidales bacterium]
MKKLFALLLIIPAILCCKEKPPVEEEPGEFEGEEYAAAAPMLKSGSTVLATNPNVEKFLTEVSYPDKNWSSTKIYDYYGGFNGKKYDENGKEDPVYGTAVKNPVSDKPQSYSVRWAQDYDAGQITFHLATSDWSSDQILNKGTRYVNITNLVPNAHYTYTATGENGKVFAKGEFNTTGHLHQVFFDKSCRNGRDLGGWETVDGKMVKYHMVYRGGRMQGETVSAKTGKAQILAEGIRAQLDLRGTSDVLSAPVFEELAFCAPIIESGGKTMLVDNAAKTKQCFEFVVNCLRENKPVYFHCSLGRDRTGTLACLLLGVLGVREGDISKEYEVTYFAPRGYSIALSEDYDTFQNNRTKWVYSDIAPYFWSLSTDGTFAKGVENYLLNVAKVSQKDIDDFRTMMLTTKK